MERVATLAELARAPRSPDEIGGKAANLARLIAAGLPVPEGVVLFPAAAGAAGRAAELAAIARDAVARLGPRLAVRSSAVVEDGAGLSAAGLFVSRLDVAPTDLAAALADVLGAAGSPAIAAYLSRRGHRPDPPAIAVVIQRMVDGPRGVIYTASPEPAHGGAALVEAEVEGIAREALVAAAAPGDPPEHGESDVGIPPGFPLGADELRALVGLARRAARAIGEEAADVEWVRGADGFALVQARPITAAAPARPSLSADLLAFSAADPTVTWTWDVEHNPDPLSTAQIGLVERVAKGSPTPLRVVAGHLYRGSPGPGSVTEPDPAAQPALDAAALRTHFHDVVGPAVDRALAATEHVDAPALAAALEAFDAVHAIYSMELAPVLARARVAATREAMPGPSDHGRALERCLAGEITGDQLREIAAPLAPAWDVAAPTFAEAPELLDAALARMSGARAAAAGPALRERAIATDPLGDLANAVAQITEADDRLYFRAQAVVRRALLELGRRLGLARRDDVFNLELAELVALERDERPLDRAALAARAESARKVREAQRELALPLVIRGGRAASSTAAPRREAWRGAGLGGIARGRVARVDDLGSLAHGRAPVIVVARAITPPMIALVAGATGLVSDHGGRLGHAATIARELGLAGVVGCVGAYDALANGDEIMVDGITGLVVRLASTPPDPDESSGAGRRSGGSAESR
jgi:pyruvate,water dikinase